MNAATMNAELKTKAFQFIVIAACIVFFSHNHCFRRRLPFGGTRSYSSISLVSIMRYTFLPFLNCLTPVIESIAGMPVRSGFKGGLTGTSFGAAALLLFLPDCRGMDFPLSSMRNTPYGLNTISVTG
jgi:hypothetical protein